MLTVLLVEDHPMNRKLFRDILEMQFQVVEAGSAEEALECLARGIPDLILLLKDGVLRERAANALVLIGDAAIEPLISFLYDPKASEVESEGERVLSFASARLRAVDALRQLVLETLQKLGWEPPQEEEKVDSSQTDNLRVDLPLGDTGRFGPSGDLAKGAM